ncbi:sugar transporter, partial [Bacillus pumilus]
LAFFSFLFSALLGYFCNYKQNLLWADQRGYEITGYFQIIGLVKTSIQMAIAYYTANYVLYLVIEILFGIAYALVLKWRVNAVYPWLRTEIKKGRQLFKKYPTIGKYIGQLFIHKIGSFVQFQITPLLIYG